MRIAFVGKGGSGKSTMSVLFSLYIDKKGYQVGLVDVDVNSHTAELLGIDDNPTLAEAANATRIKQYLAGANTHVDPDEFLKTTPPGIGSGSWELGPDNYITSNFSTSFGNRSHVFTLGSYTSDGIGSSCHHSTQSIAENMLSHAHLGEKDVVVIDSVAGNDAFANTLYAQDLLVFIVKPEREGVSVFRRFYELAKQAGVEKRVVALGNLVATVRQKEFLERELADNLVGILSTNEDIIDSRMDGRCLNADNVRSEDAKIFDEILKLAKVQCKKPNEYYDLIVKMHRKVAAEAWVAGAYRAGLEDQIDTEYQP